MGLRDAVKVAETREAEADAKAKARDIRISHQQFLNVNLPFFMAALSRGSHLDGEAVAAEMRRAVEDAIDTTERIVSAIQGESHAPRAKDLRLIRPFVVEFMSQMSEKGLAVDARHLTDLVTTVADLVDPDRDADPYAGEAYKIEHAVRMSAAAAAVKIAEVVSKYSFRRRSSDVIGEVLDAVMRAAEATQVSLLPADTSDEDRASMRQSLVRHYVALATSIYETEARRVVQALLPLPEPKRRAFFASTDPVQHIIKTFDDRASVVSAYAQIAARGIFGEWTPAADPAPSVETPAAA